MPAWPTIPDFSDDPKTFPPVLRAMTQLLQMMTGQRGGVVAPSARVFISSVDPQKLPEVIAIGSGLRTGDLWIDLGNSRKLRFWDEGSKAWGATT